MDMRFCKPNCIYMTFNEDEQNEWHKNNAGPVRHRCRRFKGVLLIHGGFHPEIIAYEHCWIMSKDPDEKYMPSNGSEGMWFTEKWCEKCTRRALNPDAKTQCIHELRACAGEDNTRWFIIDGKPTCTAFRDRKNKKRYPKKSKSDGQQMELWG